MPPTDRTLKPRMAARRSSIAMPAVVVQLQHSDGGCWQATYSTPVVNEGTQFRATAD
jgi:hypothetical protein